MMKGTLTFAAEDVRRLVEIRFNRSALVNPNELTDSATLLAAVVAAEAEAAQSADDLKVKMLAVSREGGETSEARAGMVAVGEQVASSYRYVRGEVDRALLNPPPEAQPDARTMARRQKSFGELFALTVSDFGRLTSDRKAEVLQGLVELARQAPHDDVLGNELLALITQRFLPAVAEIEGRRSHLQQEVREDRSAYAELFAARADFDRRLATLSLLVEAALTRANRLHELGRYLRAHDPAYRARLQAGQSVKEEEGVEEVTSDLGATPDAIVEPT